MNNTSNTTNLNVRVDSTLKKESDMLFKDLGAKHPERYKKYDNIDDLFKDLDSDDWFKYKA